MIFFTSDTHFGHSNIIRYCQRPFNSSEEMDLALTQNWNSLISSEDQVYILGDFMFAKSQDDLAKRLEQLNGHKYLILGNHDCQPWCQELFEWVSYYEVLELQGYRLVMFHYPLLKWNGFDDQHTFHLYGHIHNHAQNPAPRPHLAPLKMNRSLNVGIDVNNYRPITIDSIVELANCFNMLEENP